MGLRHHGRPDSDRRLGGLYPHDRRHTFCCSPLFFLHSILASERTFDILSLNMRTLTTQLRLRRLLRTQADYHRRLLEAGTGGPLATAASARLLDLLGDVRSAWQRESGELVLTDLQGHVTRSLAVMGASAAAMARPGADLTRLNTEFRDAGLPLVFFLRGLDDSDAPAVAELAGQSLARTA